MIIFELWNECNAQCTFCRPADGKIHNLTENSSISYIEKGRMPLSTYQAVIDQVKDHILIGILYLNGEPLMYKDLVPALRYATDRKVATLIATNGELLFENKIIDQINIQLIKQKYDFQSKISIKNYNLNLNSRIISKNEKDLKLTEREIDIILFLKKQNQPKKIEVLQNEIWHYSSDLETHTVETHIYRLRKKIKDQFKDENFIVSYKDGYSIE
mgnify:CR=1 FL=1